MTAILKKRFVVVFENHGHFEKFVPKTVKLYTCFDLINPFWPQNSFSIISEIFSGIFVIFGRLAAVLKKQCLKFF